MNGLHRAGPDLTREGLVEVLETFDGFDSGINAPITWGPGLRDGARACLIGKAVDGWWVHHSPRGQWIYSRIDDY